jgi:hypothetical protein
MLQWYVLVETIVRLIMSPTDLPFFDAGDDDVNVLLCHITPEFAPAEDIDEDEKQRIDCLEHESFC